MTVTLPGLAVADILERLAAAMGDEVKLRQTVNGLGDKYGLLSSEITQLAQRHGWPQPVSMRRAAAVLRGNRPGGIKTPVVPAAEAPKKPGPKPKRLVDEKRCASCSKTKPAAEFFAVKHTATGLSSHCRDCENRRSPTETRMIRVRARHRAMAALVESHRDEFARLLDLETVKAREEHEKLKQASDGNPDAGLARLKPGPKRKGQTDVTERLDVARCQSCHTHHDDEHVCPSCGDETPVERATLKAYVVRDWAVRLGIGPVPTRGPLPQRILDAYLEENPAAVSA